MKKIFFSLCFLFVMLTAAFAQDNSPIGNWAKDKIGNSDYCLEIDETTIKYVDKKTEEYITWRYNVSGEYILFGSIVDKTTTKLNPELYKPLYEDGIYQIKFKRSENKMTIYFNEKGVKFITQEAKKANGELALGAAALATALIIKEATDTVATESEVKSLADKVIDAAW